MLHVRESLHGKPLSYEAWTPELVKEHLPDVTVNMNGKVYGAAVRGRGLDFAQVHIYDPAPTARDDYEVHYLGGSFEVAWSTVAHCLNTDQPIIY